MTELDGYAAASEGAGQASTHVFTIPMSALGDKV